jgi:hypothetical protein
MDLRNTQALDAPNPAECCFSLEFCARWVAWLWMHWRPLWLSGRYSAPIKKLSSRWSSRLQFLKVIDRMEELELAEMVRRVYDKLTGA